MNNQNDVIIAGYENGWIILWDIEKKKPYSTIKKAFNAPIIQIKLWQWKRLDTYNAMASDTCGNVYFLSFKKQFFSWKLKKRLL